MSSFDAFVENSKAFAATNPKHMIVDNQLRILCPGCLEYVATENLDVGIERTLDLDGNAVNIHGTLEYCVHGHECLPVGEAIRDMAERIAPSVDVFILPKDHAPPEPFIEAMKKLLSETGRDDRVCTGCGCTTFSACTGEDGQPCHWVSDTLCSKCEV